MAQESQTVDDQQQQLQNFGQSVDSEELDDLIIVTRRNFYEKVFDMTEKFASTRIGQHVIERGDRTLRMIENTAKWSLPMVKTETKLQRPLPWLPFLTMILILRIVRISCSVVAVLIGNEPVTPRALVYFIQTRRRKLRSIRMNGLKEIRQREQEAILQKSSQSEIGVLGKLRKYLSCAICRPGEYPGQLARRIFVLQAEEQPCDNEEVPTDSSPSKQPHDDGESELNLTCAELLNKYANENSEDDSDYVPNPDDESNDDRSSSSGESCDNNTSGNKLEDIENEQSTNEDAVKSKPIESKPQDNTVEINENVNGQQHPMPKPIAEIKKEPIFDNEISGNKDAQTPKENGPSNGDGQTETDADVAAEKTKKLNVPNGGNLLQQMKSTPGHESAAMVRPKIPIGMGTTTATAVPTNINDEPSFSFTQSNIDNPDNSSLSATFNSASSSSSLASLVTNDEFIVNDNISEPRTPTPTLSSSFENSESSNLISASSSEDIFYSPIGSPPDFNSILFQPVSILKNPIVPQIPQSAEAHSTPKTVEMEELAAVTETAVDSSTADTEAAEDSPTANQKKNTIYQKNSGQNQNQQHSRYRGRNRR